MNCFTHSRSAAVGMCVVCQKGICHECVARETPRLVCHPRAQATRRRTAFSILVADIPIGSTTRCRVEAA
jgi:hypothetical protein